MEKIVPYPKQEEGKKAQVEQMFDNISKRYDLINRLISLGIDNSWRRLLISELGKFNPKHVLDVATGTADLAISASKKLTVEKVTGIDLSSGMLSVGQRKIDNAKLGDKIDLIQADCEKLPFEENTFNGAVVAFGVRNFENLGAGLKEINRVLEKGAPLFVLEFSRPKAFLIKHGYAFYMRYVLPILGKLLSGDGRAYSYLPESVKVFPEDKDFLKELTDAGFEKSSQKRLTFGICSLYCAIK